MLGNQELISNTIFRRLKKCQVIRHKKKEIKKNDPFSLSVSKVMILVAILSSFLLNIPNSLK